MIFNKTKRLLREKEAELEIALEKIAYYEKEFKELIDKNSLLAEKKEQIQEADKKLQELNSTYQRGLAIHQTLEKEISIYQESLEISSYGLYQPQYSFDTPDKFKAELEKNYNDQKKLIKEDLAVVCSTEWVVGGSKSEGKKMTNQFKRLMLFAFNGECDGLIAKVRWNNATKTGDRIIKIYNSINKLGETQQTYISEDFLKLKLAELSLTYEYEQKKYEEKEEQRLIREQIREEEKAQKELEKAQKEAEEDERRFEKALEKAKLELQGANKLNAEELQDKILDLEQKLQAAQEKKERAIAQAQLTKVGHIYVISNVGSFGDDVYKIGMTRRLDPLDRVRELGDASVPFQFDVHAIIYSENAPQLEFNLHKRFSERRLNRVNQRKEFFKVTLEEIEEFIKEHANAEIEFTKLAEAREFRETLNILEQFNNLVNKEKETSNYPKSLI